jgi:hypothetical protein
VIDDRLADELERIGVEGRASILAEFAASSRVAARRNRPADDRTVGPGSSWIWIASQLCVTQKAAQERYGKISPQPGRAAFNTDEHSGSNSATI